MQLGQTIVKKMKINNEQLPHKETDKEDGEVSGEESDNEEKMPICRFFITNSCTRGDYCKFRHPVSKTMGNYDMFKPSERTYSQGIYPNTTWMRDSSTYTQQFDYSVGQRETYDSSFQDNLQDLKQLMQASGYRVGQTDHQYRKHKPWIEANDLDTDPYYTNQHPQVNYSFLMDSNRKATTVSNESPVSSRSSSPDYSSTTDSLSSLSFGSPKPINLRTYSSKVERSDSSVNCYSSESETYKSTTSCSESSSAGFNYRESAYKKKYYKSSELELRRRRYLKRRLKYVEDLIIRTEKRRKLHMY